MVAVHHLLRSSLDTRGGVAIQPDGPVGDRRIAIEFAVPERIADHHARRPASWLIVLRLKYTAGCRRNMQQVEEVSADEKALGVASFAFLAEVEGLRAPCQHFGESLLLAAHAAVTLVLVGVAIVWGLVLHWTSAPVPSAAEPVRPALASAPPRPSPTGQTGAPKAAPRVPPDREAKPRHGIPTAQDGITRRVLPDIPAKARNTVHGKATVVVRVAVDPSGNVTEATLERGGSPYFGKLALEAARHWQFGPVEGAGPRNWILRFEIMRTATQVIALRVGPQ